MHRPAKLHSPIVGHPKLLRLDTQLDTRNGGMIQPRQ